MTEEMDMATGAAAGMTMRYRTVEILTGVEGCMVVVKHRDGRRYRVTNVMEEMRHGARGPQYAVTLIGPVLIRGGRDHAKLRASQSYYRVGDGTLRAAADANGEVFPAELEHLLRGHAALEAFGWPAEAVATGREVQ